MLNLVLTQKMKRDAKRMEKRGQDMSKLKEVLGLLISGKPLPPKYKDHPLRGPLQGFRECHIESDWLLVYRIIKDELLLLATATGTHSDLFGS
ncbi:MAG: type II toxin-antitoxin system YafQ family toxin [Holophagales bacterium]|jgi:mRNA interferase YafQ|nr:type II toxin-antitoxin system YafQ family toxin [Holophagales bacterium]